MTRGVTHVAGEMSYCVAVGPRAGLDELSYGEILVSTGRASLRALPDGTIEVGGTFVARDDEVVHCLRSLLGQELPGRPSDPGVWKLFESYGRRSLSLPNNHGCVLVGPGARSTVDGEIVFRNRFGGEFRVVPGEVVSPREAHAALRALFLLSPLAGGGTRP